MSFNVVIPARLNSSRLKEKVLIEINDVPMVIHVAKKASLSPKLPYNDLRQHKPMQIIMSRRVHGSADSPNENQAPNFRAARNLTRTN